MWINTAIIQWAEWLWFSISLTKNKIEYMLNSVKNYWVIKRPYIWISYILLSETIQKEYNLKTSEWLYVVNETWWVIQWSPAEKSWIKPWDIITKINWKKITWSSDLNQIIQNKFPWNTVNLTILREWQNKELNIEVVLGEI
jgi:S1-C subfamily serine protease